MSAQAPPCPLLDEEVALDPSTPEFDALVRELGAPVPQRRPWTADVADPTTGGTRITVKRACNGCGFFVGDATPDELERAVHGAPLPDVTGECLVCGLIPAPRDRS